MLVRRALTALMTGTLVAALAACTDPVNGSAGVGTAGDETGSSSAPDDEVTAGAVDPPPPPAQVVLNVARRGVPVDATVRVSAEGGRLAEVRVRSREGRLGGRLAAGGSWVASERLEPGTAYVVEAVSVSEAGVRDRTRRRFRTQTLAEGQETFASVAPLDGETVGVGMPVVVFFDVPVSDRAEMERQMSVTSKPAQSGSWHWITDSEVHWRPKTYWRAGTTVSVDLAINSVAAGGGVFGQEDRHIDFAVGSANVYRVDAAAHQMRVYSGGDLLRTLPVTTGGPDYTTRSGVKVIMEKWESRTMNSETVGIDPDGPDGYVIDGVRWAMRLTYSGEFIHAAPWSVASQGVANVSHGCTGMSTADAKWLFDLSKRGDVVEYVGSDRPMELANGFGDWNLSFADYREGSAL